MMKKFIKTFLNLIIRKPSPSVCRNVGMNTVTKSLQSHVHACLCANHTHLLPLRYTFSTILSGILSRSCHTIAHFFRHIQIRLIDYLN